MEINNGQYTGKVLLLNGSLHPAGSTFTLLDEIRKTLEQEGIVCEIRHIGSGPVQDCMACGYCKKHGRCVVDDQVNEIADRLQEYDGLIVGSPVYFSGCSGQLGSFLDRLFYAFHPLMAGKAAASVTALRRAGSTAALERINQYFLYSNMLVVGSQYWNQAHGKTPEEIRQDQEGMQIMRTLARNMAWVIKSIACGRNEGILFPEQEPRQRTSIPELISGGAGR